MTPELYLPGRSAVHRVPAGWKVLAVFAAGTALVAIDDLRVLGVVAAGVLGGYRAAGIPWRTAVAQVRVIAPVLAVLCAVQWVTAGAAEAGAGALRLATLVALAALVTLTTRVSDMVEVIERALRPLRHLGLRVDRISLAISMTLRFIPLLTRVAAEVREAQRARGLDRNVLALAVPVLVRALRTADQVAEAIDARSAGAS